MGWSIRLGGIVVNVAGVIGIKFAQHAQHQTLSLFGYAAYFVGFVVISFSFTHDLQKCRELNKGVLVDRFEV